MQQNPPLAPVHLSHRQILTVMSALMMGMLLAALDQTVVSTALPTIVRQMHDLAHLSWVVTAYLLASTISTPLYGKLGDLYGRKPLFLFAISVFLVGSMLSGLAQNMAQLIGFRALQGLGAGGLMVGAQAIIGDVVPPRERGRYQGMMGGVFALASIAGPLLGGFLTDDVSWRWIFYINVPVGAVALFVAATQLHLPPRHKQHSIDWLGAFLLAAAASALILLTTWAGTEYAWGSPQILGLGIATVLLTTVFFVWERGVAEPIISPRLFRNAVFNVSSGVGFVIGLSMFGAIVFLPLFLQLVDGASATGSGLNLIPLMAGLLTSSITSGRIISRTGRYKIFPVTGTLLATAGMALLATIDPHTPRLVLSLYMVVLGAGMGMVMQVLVLAIQNAVEYRDLGVATSSATFLRSIGSSLGVSIFGAIFASQIASRAAGVNVTALQGDPSQVAALPAAVRLHIAQAVSDSLHVVFLSAIPFLIAGFLLTLFLREVPLRGRAGAAVDAPIEDEATALSAIA